MIEGWLDSASMSSDDGEMQLAQVDRKQGLPDAAARCIANPRSSLLIKNGVHDMGRLRVYGLTLGWEDLNDQDALRRDVTVQTAVGVEREVARAPTLRT